MKSRANWNDMNESSEPSGGSSDEEIVNIIKNNKAKEEEIPSLQKSVSSPEKPLKSQRFDNKAKIMENLEKLSKHTEPTVWLYLMEVANRQAEVSQILRSIPDFQEVNPAGRGWNVLVKIQDASKYMEGYSEGGINLKFIYSNKNEQRQARKQVKKYSQKSKYAEDRDDYEEIRSPRMKQKQKSTYSQKGSYQKDRQYGDGRDKKKIKYVAKDAVKKQEKKPIEKKQEAIKKIHEEEQEEDTSSLEKREIENKKIDNGKAQENNKRQVQASQQLNGKNTKNRQDDASSQKRNNNNNQQQRIQTQVQRKQDISDSDSPSKQVKADRKKNKKKNKNSRNGFNDPNNPFSVLIQ